MPVMNAQRLPRFPKRPNSANIPAMKMLMARPMTFTTSEASGIASAIPMKKPSTINVIASPTTKYELPPNSSTNELMTESAAIQ